MAFPQVVGTPTESSLNTAGTSHVISLPALNTNGNLVLILIDKGSTSGTFNALAGWNEILDENLGNGIAILWRVVDGTEGATVTLTHSTSTRGAYIVYEISGAESPSVQPPELSTVATGTSTGPDPSTCTPTGGAKDYLWIAMFGCAGEEADDDTWCNSAPSTPSAFGTLVQKSCGTAGTNLGGIIASAHLASNAASMNPGAFNQDGSLAWRAYTIAVHPVTTATVVSTVDEVSGSLNVAQQFLTTIGSTLAKSKASLNILLPHITLSASANITASGENTTAQLTAPAGKTTADFGGGRIQDDENPGDAVDLATGDYREDEWSIEFTATAEPGETYEFRVVLADGTPLDTYAVTPQLTLVGSVEATVVSTIDEVTASLNAVQQFLLTIDSDLDKVTAALNADMLPTTTIQSTIDKVMASLNAVVTDVAVNVVSTIDKVTASLNVVMHPSVTVQSTIDEVSGSLNAEQVYLVTIDSDIDKVTASLEVAMQPTVAIVSTIDEVAASFNVLAGVVGATIVSTLDEVLASINVVMQPAVTIQSTLDEVLASLTLEQRQLVTIATTIDEATANLTAQQIYFATIAATLDKTTGSFTVSQLYLLTVVSTLAEVRASLNAVIPASVTIASTLDEVLASITVAAEVFENIIMLGNGVRSLTTAPGTGVHDPTANPSNGVSASSVTLASGVRSPLDV